MLRQRENIPWTPREEDHLLPCIEEHSHLLRTAKQACYRAYKPRTANLLRSKCNQLRAGRKHQSCVYQTNMAPCMPSPRNWARIPSVTSATCRRATGAQAKPLPRLVRRPRPSLFHVPTSTNTRCRVFFDPGSLSVGKDLI
jgi:hypothetical protein